MHLTVFPHSLAQRLPNLVLIMGYGQGYCYGLWSFDVLWVLIRNQLCGRKILWVFTDYGLP